MKALSIRNLPDDVYEALKAMAAANHRSMQEQVRCLIEREARLAASPGLAAARAWRVRLAGRNLGDTVEDVRLDRAR
ncbi:MAG: plasmid stability protein [Rhodocyclaceae bacterium]|nr:plasmid stability protein [Rhodocyclaceae bacterium]MBK6555371.1 plasmid stability protein [Rhodocyclaceae bacterium]MBK6676721.1 plasmid stability protein [Rhodocyclaceae bacterium]MBK9309346.1 plasmid stability protein [Rhodocyclaceae bacterium]MBK9955560.1 plasmid stability protein [Rhodocyclaceae bacterium]